MLNDEQVRFGLNLGMSLAANKEIKPVPASNPGSLTGRRALLADSARAEGELELKWSSASSKAEKYLAPLRPIMQKLGHIGKTPVFYNWCAAFVTWNCRKAGYDIPDQPVGFWASMALVESWKHWGNQQGILRRDPTIGDLRPGDIVLYEWFDGDSQLDHIGVFLERDGASNIVSAEGNAGNKTAVMRRKFANASAIVALPD